MIYTRGLTSFVLLAVGFWLSWRPEGLALLRSAFGIESKLWLGLWTVAAMVPAFWLSSEVALRAYLYRTVKVYGAHPLEPGEAGLFDIPFWSSAAAFVSAVGIFLWIEPGASARWRPAVIVFLTVMVAAVMSGRLAVAVASAVHGPSIVRKAITRKQCAKRYSGGRQCSNWTFRWGDACRWHINAIETAQRYGRRARTRQTLGAGWFCLGLFALTRFLGETNLFWATLAVAAVGTGVRLIAEGIIAPYYSLSQLPIWPKAQALGLVSQAVGATAMLIVVGSRPETARPLVALLGDSEVWLAFGPAVVYVASAALVIVGWDVLIARVLHYEMGGIASVVGLFSLLPMKKLIEGPLLRHSPLGRWESDDFWSPLLGHAHARVLVFAYLGAYIAAEMVARFMAARRRREPGKPSVRFLGCALAALLAMLATRYILHWSGVSGTILFVALTLALSAMTCFLILWLRDHVPAASAGRG